MNTEQLERVKRAIFKDQASASEIDAVFEHIERQQKTISQLLVYLKEFTDKSKIPASVSDHLRTYDGTLS